MASYKISKREKVFFPADQVTKGDLADYYEDVSNHLIKYAKDRAVTLRRFPDGISKEGFYQKNTPAYFPDWFPTASLPTDEGSAIYPMISSKRALLYAVDQGTVEFHSALSKIDKPNLPDRLIFDLDPSDDDFNKVRELALALKRLFDDAGVNAFAMVTGSRGLHVTVPLRRTKEGDFDAIRSLAKKIADDLATDHPQTATTQQRKAQRGARVFVDYLRNAYGQTSVAPFSVRAKPEAPIATPVSWSEVRSRALTPRKYTIKNLLRRLSQQSEDPWAAFGKTSTTYSRLRDSFGTE